MSIDEIVKTITDVENKVDNIKEMIADYNACKNDTSKTYLLAAIAKMTRSIMPNQTTTRGLPEA